MTPAETYVALHDHAEREPQVAAFWLGGSRGKGRATAQSDYDCTVILANEAPETVRRNIAGYRQPGVDVTIMTLDAFETYADWGSATAWDRYSFAHVTAAVDKAGQVQPLIEAKSRVPPSVVGAFIDSSLDHLTNQLYRALKCLRDGDPAASRLEAAEAVAPFLDAVFALHGGRLRPYYKYLAWELETYPLEPLTGGGLVDRLLAAQGPQAALALQALVADTQSLFHDAGHGAAFEGWGDAMDWMLTWTPRV
jgi:hypothetical protein